MHKITLLSCILASLALAADQSEFEREKQAQEELARQTAATARANVKRGGTSQGTDNSQVIDVRNNNAVVNADRIQLKVAATDADGNELSVAQLKQIMLRGPSGEPEGSYFAASSADPTAALAARSDSGLSSTMQGKVQSAQARGNSSDADREALANGEMTGATVTNGAQEYDRTVGAAQRTDFVNSQEGEILKTTNIPKEDPAQTWWRNQKSGKYVFDVEVGMMQVLGRIRHEDIPGSPEALETTLQDAQGQPIHLKGELENFWLPVPIHMWGGQISLRNLVRPLESVGPNSEIYMLLKVYPKERGCRVELTYNTKWRSFSVGRMFGSTKWRDLNWPWVSGFVQAFLSQLGSQNSRALLQAQLSQVEGELSSLQDQVSAAQAQVTAASANTTLAQTAFNDATTALSTAQAALTTAQTALTSAESYLVTANTTLATIQWNISVNSNSVNSLSGQAQSYRNQIAGYTQQLAQPEITEAQRTALQTQMSAAQSALNNTNTQLFFASSNLNAYRQSAVTQAQVVTNAQAAVTTAQTNVTAAQTEVTSKEGAVATATLALTDARATENTFRNGGVTTDSDGNPLQIQAADALLAQATGRIQALQAQADDIRRRLDALPADEAAAREASIAQTTSRAAEDTVASGSTATKLQELPSSSALAASAGSSNLVASADLTDEMRANIRGTTSNEPTEFDRQRTAQATSVVVSGDTDLSQVALANAMTTQQAAPVNQTPTAAQTANMDRSLAYAQPVQGTVGSAFVQQQNPVDLSSGQTSLSLPALGGGNQQDRSGPPPQNDTPPTG